MESQGAAALEKEVSNPVPSVEAKAVVAEIEERVKQISFNPPPKSPPGNLGAKVQALGKIQRQIIDKEVKFNHMAHALAVDFQSEFNECYEALARIVNGSDVVQRMEPDAVAHEAAGQTTGIADFWLTVLKGSILSGQIGAPDEAALKKLKDLRCVLKGLPMPGFVLEFHFEPNDYFTNEVLTKEYFLRYAPNTLKPSVVDGFEIYDCVGCKIDWKPGHNLIEASEVAEANDGASSSGGVTFFSFFEPEKFTNDDLDAEINGAMLEWDFQYGYCIREMIIPRAVSLYLKEVCSVKETCRNCGNERCVYTDYVKFIPCCSSTVADDELGNSTMVVEVGSVADESAHEEKQTDGST
ncbi:nucleosome assembly protein 1-like 1 [Anopheles bellator]|uniref:nucleosome assembly protein 1-like 1 n=1 Tax=Anopheles bellator TaxID=139047 RepID=UPI00264A0287|nr:nucleosome assembly protein 1-like 1 [Anopheles bellator]